MDDEWDLPARLRLPESFAESGDPIGANPFPTEHPAYQVWIDATRQAEIEVSRINFEASSSLTPESAGDWMPQQVVAKFDAWARRGVQVVWTDDAVRAYDRWLVDYANAWIESVSQLLMSHAPPFSRGTVVADLHRRLTARVHHWKAEARRYRVQQEAHTAAVAPEMPQPPSKELIERRRRAVRKYGDDHELDAVGFAGAVGISDSVVRAIIREDRTRFKPAAQAKLLALIGMTREQWYRE
jgi:hypothetical protein